MEPAPAALGAQLEVCAALSRPHGLILTVATASDIGTVFSMVNVAYKVEDGDKGVAFKKTDRFLSHDEGNVFDVSRMQRIQQNLADTPLLAPGSSPIHN